MAKPNRLRCPRCRAKIKPRYGITTYYTCNRCGYTKTEEYDNYTKTLLWGPLFKAKRGDNHGKK